MGGIAAPKALQLGANLLGDEDRARLTRAVTLIHEGRSMSSALQEAQLADPVAASMLAVAERTGALAEILGAHRRISRIPPAALRRADQPPVRADPDDRDRPGHRRHRRADVPADLRSGLQPPMNRSRAITMSIIMSSGFSKHTESAGPRRLDAALVQEALKQRRDALAHRLAGRTAGRERGSAAARRGQVLRCAGAAHCRLRELRPDFSLVSFAECQRRNCLVGRHGDEEAVDVVLTDPTDTRLRQWLECVSASARPTSRWPPPPTCRPSWSPPRSRCGRWTPSRCSPIAWPPTSRGWRSRCRNIDATESPVVRLVDSTLVRRAAHRRQRHPPGDAARPA